MYVLCGLILCRALCILMDPLQQVFARETKNYILLEIHFFFFLVTESFYYWLYFHSAILDGKSLVI